MLRNSGFWFAQVQNPAVSTDISPTSSTTLRNINADGWGATNETANTQYLRVDTNAAPETGFGGRYYGRWTKTVAAGKIAITQAVESVNMQHVRGKTVRVQVLLKTVSVTPVTWRLGLIQLAAAGTVDVIGGRLAATSWISAWNATGTDPTLTAANNTAYIAPNATGLDNTTLVGNAANCVVTSAWQRFGATFDVPTNCHNLIVSIWSNDDVAVADGISIAEGSLTNGTDIVTFQPLSYDLEFNRCQRYIVKTFLPDTAPAQSAGITTGALRAIFGKAGAAANGLQLFWRLPVPTRSTGLLDINLFPLPGVNRYNPSAANAEARNSTGATDCTLTTASHNRTSVSVTATGPAGVAVGDLGTIHIMVFDEL